MQITVTGGAGGIGRYVVAHLLDQGADVVVIDRCAWEPSEAGTQAPHRMVVGRVDDPATVADALAGSDALVHLAGIPSPLNHEPITVFTNNTAATMTVLTQAAEQGITAAVIASSICILGLVYSPQEFSPVYVPVDPDHPLRAEDAYALAKQCDEATAAMTWRRYGLNVLAYRFPYTTAPAARHERIELMSRDPKEGARELWAYLDMRDAARACWLGVQAMLDGRVTGFHALNIVAADSLIDTALPELMQHYHPGTEQRPELGLMRTAYTTAEAERLIGFTAAEAR